MTDLKDKKIIYTFDTREDYDDLMQYLEDEGVRWCSGNKLTEFKPASLKKIVDEIGTIAVVLKSKSLTWDIKSEIERRYSNGKGFEKVHWKKGKKKDISLADFLGWEEDVAYKMGDFVNKIKDGKIYVKNRITGEWDVAFDCEDFRSATKYEPKYRIETPFLSSHGRQYLSKEKGMGDTFVAAKLNSADVIQEFTKEEAEKLVIDYRINHITEIVEVVE